MASLVVDVVGAADGHDEASPERNIDAPGETEPRTAPSEPAAAAHDDDDRPDTEPLKFAYDAAAHDLRGLIAAALGLDEAELGRAHCHLDADTAKAPSRRRNWGSKSSRNEYNRRWRSLSSADPGLASRFSEAYGRFVAEVCAPLVSGGLEHGVVYQKVPTLRIGVPQDKPLGKRHCDAEYGHQPAEVNFWIPLTACAGSNTLWTESRPGEGDFAPLEGGLGDGFRFDGNQCVHYTVPNETDTTRVSLDFRVVAKHRHDDHFVGGCALRDGKNIARFRVGGWYAEAAR